MLCNVWVEGPSFDQGWGAMIADDDHDVVFCSSFARFLNQTFLSNPYSYCEAAYIARIRAEQDGPGYGEF
jgi:hypothetical protein